MSPTCDASGERAAILHLLPDLQLGGGQQVLVRHLREMDPDRFVHHVAYFGPPHDLAAAFHEAGARLHDLGAWSWRRAPGVLARLLRLAARESIALVHTNGTPVDKLHGQLVALLRGLPHVTTLHGMTLQIGPLSLRPRPLAHRAVGSSLRELERWLDRRTLRAVIAVSDAVREDWRNQLAARGVPDSRVRVIYSGIPVEEFARASPERDRTRAELGVDPDDPLLISVARLDVGKGLEILLPMLGQVRERHPRARLWIVGDGPLRQRLAAERDARGIGPAVALLGQRQDVARLLGAADVFVFPSVREGFGLVVLEALAAGLPVVSTALPSLRPLADETPEALRIVDPDPGEFASAVEALLDRPDRGHALGLLGRESVRARWDVASSAARYEAVYREILGAP